MFRKTFVFYKQILHGVLENNSNHFILSPPAPRITKGSIIWLGSQKYKYKTWQELWFLSVKPYNFGIFFLYEKKNSLFYFFFF
jgi:hypothetical protein